VDLTNALYPHANPDGGKTIPHAILTDLMALTHRTRNLLYYFYK